MKKSESKERERMKTIGEMINFINNMKSDDDGKVILYADEVDELLNCLINCRAESQIMDEEHKIYMRAIEEHKKEYEPIETWDDLKMMRKKPVWIEQIATNKVYSGWVIANEITDEYMMTNDRLFCNDRLFWQKDFGKAWIAHRKEAHSLLQKRMAEKIALAGIE